MTQSQGPTNPLLTLPGLSDDADVGGSLSRTPWWRRRGIIIGFTIFLLILLVGGGTLFLLNRRRPVRYDFQSATNGNVLSISATGPIQSGIYNLSFTGSGGKIDAINVKVGQTVQKGQVLAQLDKTALQDAVNQAQAALLAAQNNLGSVQNSLTKTQAQMQASVASAQTALNNDQTNLTNTQNEGQASIASSQTALSNDQTSLTNTQNTSQASINSAQTTLNNDQTALQNTQAQSQAQLQVAQQSVNSACNATPPATPSTSSCQAAQASYNQVVAQTNSANASAQGKVNSDQQSLAQAQATANANIAAAQAKIASDQKALQQATITANANASSAQSKIAADQQALAQAQAQANATITQSQGQITTQQGQLASALSQLQTAQDNLANNTLLAPHSGIVTIINGTVGGTPGSPATGSSSTAAGSGTFIQIVDTSALQVVANVNEADTANLKVGQAATFTVNAYGNRLFKGTVSAISPNGQTVSSVVTYPLYIDVDMSSSNLNGTTLLPGMTANVTVTVLNRNNVLLIPVNALNFARVAITGNTTTNVPQLLSSQEAASATAQARQMMIQLENQNPAVVADSPTPAFVLERNGTQIVVKPIVVGLTDGTVYEVLAGLSPNEAIIVGTSTATRGLFSGGASGSSGLVGQSTHATV